MEERQKIFTCIFGVSYFMVIYNCIMDTDVIPVTSNELIVGRRYCLKEHDDCEDLGFL